MTTIWIRFPHRLCLSESEQSLIPKVLILINGHNKARALAKTVEGGVSQRWTCSALQMHNNAIIACDEEACGELTVDTYKYFLDIEKNERL